MSLELNKKRLIKFNEKCKKYKNLYVVATEHIRTKDLKNIETSNVKTLVKKIKSKILEIYFEKKIKIPEQAHCILSDMGPHEMLKIIENTTSYRELKKNQKIIKTTFEIPAQKTFHRANSEFHNLKSKYPIKLKKGLIDIPQSFKIEHPGGIVDESIVSLTKFIRPAILQRKLKIIQYKNISNNLTLDRYMLNFVSNFQLYYRTLAGYVEKTMTKNLEFTGYNFMAL